MGAILSDAVIQSSIDSIGGCMVDLGLTFEMPSINDPGLGSILKAFIELIESGFENMFKPIAELKKIITDYLANPPVFLEKITSFISDTKELLTNPIEFIINKLIEPLSKNINIPVQLDLSFLIPGFTVDIKEGFLKLPKDVQERIEKMIETAPEYFEKLMEFILMPLKLIIGIIIELIKLLAEALADPVGKLVALIAKITTDFVGFISDLVGIILKPILEVMIKSIAGVAEGVEEVVGIILGLINDIFSGVSIDMSALFNNKLFAKISGFVGLLLCFMKFFLSFITEFPKLFFG